MLAMAAEQNEKSVRLITRAGFVRVARLDGDYALYHAVLSETPPHDRN
jgi:RimJ/RimL family protein N-acetyltransferase